MDTEALKSLVWLIAGGAVFFLMMRFGCGAHIGGHGHGGRHAGHGPPESGKATTDPVCGMPVDAQRPAATSQYGGTTFYFCSDSCRQKFEQAPEKYAGDAAPASHQGHHHG